MLLERDNELQTLETAFQAVAGSGGRLVLVCGEAGIGKSSLIARFTEGLAAPCRLAWGYCDPLTTPRPLGPVRDIAAEVLGPEQGESEEARYFEGLVQGIAGVGRPVVLVIEDLHWADDRSLDWLKFVGRRIAMLPLLLICSFRDDEVDATHPLRAALGQIPAARKAQLTLTPLSLEAIRQMAGHTALSAERLMEITTGNPFFLTEVISQPDLPLPGDPAPHSEAARMVPHSVADALNARLDRMPVDVVRLLEEASCWPGAVPQALLVGLGAVDTPVDTPGALAHAIRHRLLIATDGRLSFRHELARLAVYNRMVAPQRAAVHARFLAALTARNDKAALDMIVHHAEGAGDKAALLRHAPRAADAAAALGAHREAAEYLARAVRLTDGLPPAEAAEIHERWAYEAGLSMAVDTEVIAARQKAVPLWRAAGCAERVGENLRWLSRLHWYRGEAEEAQRYIEEAIGLLERGSAFAAKGKAYALRAQFFMLKDRMAEAVTWGQRALTMADQVDDAELRVHALNTIGTARLFRGDTGGEALLRESLALSRAHGFHEQAARVYTNLSECLIELRALDRAEALLEEGIAFDAAHDLDAWTYYLVGRKAQLRFEQDRYDEAATIARDVLDRDNQTLLMKMPSMIILARTGLRMGEASAAERLAEALEAAGRIGEPQYLVPLRVAEIEHAVLSGTPEAGRAAQGWLQQLAPDLLSPRKRGEALFWARLAGLDGGASDLRDLPSGFGLFLSGQPRAAAVAFEQDASAYLAAWALVAAGAPDDLRTADALFRKAGALAARRCLRARASGSAAADLGRLERGPYRAARKHPYGLTGKEQIVLRRLVDGQSNATIALHLGRSRRTVENHVSSILSKLQARNRVDIVLRTQSEPWILDEN